MSEARPATRHSCLYRGKVSHQRRQPRHHAFSYRLFMVYLDLDELDTVFAKRWLWSVERRNVAAFHRSDYFGDPQIPLGDAVRSRVSAALGRTISGPVRMLTHLRYFGYSFNPVTFYFCFEAKDSRPSAVLAEITNTPWGERHAYVLTGSPDSPTRHLQQSFPKEFHVSPFLPMQLEYDWRVGAPSQRLAIHMRDLQDGQIVFDATLALRREEINGTNLALCLLRHPFMTAKVIAAIHWQALRLWFKKCPIHAHPRHRSKNGEPSDPPITTPWSHRGNR